MSKSVASQQAGERHQQQKLDLQKQPLRNMAKNETLTPELALSPPYRSRDPQVHQLARSIIKIVKSIAVLDCNLAGTRGRCPRRRARMTARGAPLNRHSERQR